MVDKIAQLREMSGVDSIMLHFPPWYGADKALAALELFAGEVIPKFRTDAKARAAAVRPG